MTCSTALVPFLPPGESVEDEETEREGPIAARTDIETPGALRTLAELMLGLDWRPTETFPEDPVPRTAELGMLMEVLMTEEDDEEVGMEVALREL